MHVKRKAYTLTDKMPGQVLKFECTEIGQNSSQRRYQMFRYTFPKGVVEGMIIGQVS